MAASALGNLNANMSQTAMAWTAFFLAEDLSQLLILFRKAVNGESLPRIVHADESISNWDYNAKMPLTKHAGIHGAVEISKGCGRNCQFCTPNDAA